MLCYACYLIPLKWEFIKNFHLDLPKLSTLFFISALEDWLLAKAWPWPWPWYKFFNLLSLSWWLNCSVDPESREGGFTSLFSLGWSSKFTSSEGVSGLAGVGSLGASDDKESATIICQDFHAQIVSSYQWVIFITFHQPLTRSKKKDGPSLDCSKTSNVNEKSVPEAI